MNFKTEQEEFWAGDFGNEYTDRNEGINWIASNTAFFAKIFKSTGNVNSVTEFGCNRGLNLKAIRALLPDCKLSGVEINDYAAKMVEKELGINVFNGSLFDYSSKTPAEMTLIKGVLIHLNPKFLDQAYTKLYEVSSKYICIAEYYNPSPVTISYRGHEDRLFKRDFAGEMINKYDDLTLVDYGFAYHKDPLFPQDDLTWFLMKKN
jgi:spore coat polysaccharide biosynthesis protein SpsF